MNHIPGQMAAPSDSPEAVTPLAPVPPNEPSAAPAGEETTASGSARAAVVPGWVPGWLAVLCGLSLTLMANQIRLPFLKGFPAAFALSDFAFLLAFFCVLAVTVRYRKALSLPWCAVLPVLASAGANIAAGSGLPGGIEVAQTALLLTGGTMFFAFLLRYLPKTAFFGMLGGLILNLSAAAWQLFQSGAWLSYAPKDIVELPWGIGESMTGLFRSQTAFSLYLAAVLLWVIPPCLASTKKRLFGQTGAVLLTLSGLLLIPSAPFALLAAAGLLLAAFALSTRAGLLTAASAAAAAAVAFSIPSLQIADTWRATLSPLKGYDYAPDASKLFNTGTPHRSEDASPAAAQLKTSHYDFLAACRLAAHHPLHGVGSKNYQKSIGKAYGLNEAHRDAPLPKPQLNDIPTDTQAGWGILLATLGIPASLVFALVFLGLTGQCLRQYRRSPDAQGTAHVSAALILLLWFLAMFWTDPLTKGIGWPFMLALAAAAVPADRTRDDSPSWTTLRLCLCFFAPAAVAVAAIPLASRFFPARPEQKITIMKFSAPAAKTVLPDKPAVPAPETPVASPVQPPEPQEKSVAAAPVPLDDSHVLIAEQTDELFLLFSPKHAVRITPPMERITDPSGDYADGLLQIRDGAGVPPPGKEPALEFGGCVFEFELKQDTDACLWFNVQWDGSCGNTLDVAVDGSATSYTVGNDGTYNAWHWQKSPKTYHFKAGRHRIDVLNREDGILLSQVLLLSDKEYIPEGKEEP